ncbi:MAG: LPS-assembly protein LptD [Bryobacteraceae bacterium]
MSLSNIIGRICHEVFWWGALVCLLTAATAAAQAPEKRTRLASPHNLPEGETMIDAVDQEQDGSWYHLRGDAYVENHELLLKADEIDYNDDTGDAEARGHVYLQHFDGGDELWCDKADYNVVQLKGKFYNVRGISPVKMVVRRGILPTQNPFHFEGEWAERVGDRYYLHNGWITNCMGAKPWWVMKGPLFDIIPDDRALAYRSVFWIRKLPLFYTPYFYHSLKRLPRRSGLLTPNIGNSSQFGKVLGFGAYWAINRSYDMLYRAQYFSERGIAHHVELRGKPRQGTDFDAIVYGINDREKQGGLMAYVQGRSDLGDGWYARVEANYLSSFLFRQSFTQSYDEVISAEVHSTGFVEKDWSSYGLAVVLQRNENFQSIAPGDTVIIRKLPEVDFTSRDHRIWRKFPLWISWDSSAGLLHRTQLTFQTRQFVDRLDLYPRVMSAFHWKGFSLLPSFAIRETYYDETEQNGQISGENAIRSAREVNVDLLAPSLERVYHGKLKHVIETRATYRYVTGVNDFGELVRFDSTELYSDTNEVDFSLTNRLYRKRGDSVEEILNWRLSYDRFFDPTFGGAIVPGQRNVVLSAIDMTPYAFLDGYRHSSPVDSVLRMNPRPGWSVEWRSDYDPLRGTIVNNALGIDARFGQYAFYVGHNTIRDVPLLSPSSNQFDGRFSIGNENRRGWNGVVRANYDFEYGILRTATAQVNYNTDCCGFSVQVQRINAGTRDDNVFRLSFSVANLGSFGNLKKQDRAF